MADQSSKKFTFSIQVLNDVLTQTKSIKKKLGPLLLRFQQYQISQIYQTLDYLNQCMTKPKAQLRYKFNSLFVLKVLLDTSNFVLVNWIQVFFLPHLVDIVKFNLGGGQNSGKDYFLKQGYTAADDPEVEKFGFNYTLLATELIQVASMVKPFKLFESEFTETKSDFVVAVEQLKKAGFKPQQKLSMYPKPQVVQGMIAKYEQVLAELSQNDQFSDIYAEFSNVKLEEYLSRKHGSEQQKYQISIVQIYESGDLFLSSQAIEICKAEISEPRSLLTLQNALTIFHRLILSADYEAFYVLNYQDGLNKAIIDVIECDKVERGLRRGENFFAQFKNVKDSARIYTLLLDYLQKWALLTGGFVKDDENVIRNIIVGLTLKIQLPQPSNLEAEKKKFQACLSRNKQRTHRLAEEIQKSPSALKQVLTHINQSAQKLSSISQINQSKKKDPIVTSSKLQSSNSMTTPNGLPQKSSKEHSFIQQLNLVQEVYDKFLDDEKNFNKNKTILQQFLSTFENEIASVPEQVFNQVYERALNLQTDTEEILKKAEVKKSIKKQQPKAQLDKTSLKVESEVKKAVAIESEVNKAAVNLTSEVKIITKKIESQTVIEGRVEPERKSIARMEGMKESKKMTIEDTPVKRFEMEDSQKNDVERLGYNNSNKVDSYREIAQKIQSNSQKDIRSGYEEISNMPVTTSKQSMNQNQVKIKYEQQNISNLSNKNITSSANKHNLGYEQVNKKSSKEVNQYIHPSSYGYDKSPPHIEVGRQSSQDYEEPQRQIPSHKTIRKTENLSQSRKRLEESSIKSNSRVQHFSPESSQFSQHDPRQYENCNFKKKNYSPQELQVLEEFDEEPVYVNKPKEFKSLTGQNRDKNRTSSQLITPQKPQPELRLGLHERLELHERQPSEHNISQNLMIQSQANNEPLGFPSQQSHKPVTISQKNMPNSNFELQEQPEELQDLVLDEDYIDPPHINPLEQSFHDIGQLQKKIQSMINNPNSNQNSNQLSFKNCFETDKYILQRQQDKKTKMYWMQNDTTNLVKNILIKKDKSRVSKINVPQILDERNKKYQQQLKIVQQQKNKKIKELQGKIKNLQKESQFFKQQVVQHAQQIRTLKANSDFDKESVGQKGYLKDVQNIAIQHKFSSPQRFAYSGVKTYHFDVNNLKQTAYLDPKGRLINSKQYKEYFKQFTREKEKKLMLKNKDLLHKGKDMEIGFMSKKENDRLIITLYVTPERDIESLSWTVHYDDGLIVESQPNSFITYIRTKKQEKIFFTIMVNRPSFTLPRVEFTYTASQQTHTVQVVLPCTFQKFLCIKECDNDLNEYFKRNQTIVRGQEVPYSKKVLKNLDSLKEYFQSMSVLNKGNANEQGEISYGGMAVYKQYQFPVRICVKPNQFLYVQGVMSSLDEAQAQTAILEYYISTMTHLLMKEIQ